jgi:hypothetical protein
MNKKIYAILGLMLIGGIATYLIMNRKENSFADADIRVKNSSDVQKLLLVDMNGNKILLKKNNTDWMMNDSQYARTDAVDNILRILRNIEPVQPAGSASHNAIIKELSTTGTKVEAFDAQNKLLTSFTIGSSIDNGKNNFILKTGCNKPYLYRDMAFTGDISISFFTTASEWRDRKIWRYKADSIAKIWVCYADFADSNFMIDNTTNDYQMKYLNGTAMAVSKTKVKQYMNLYSSAYCLNYENQMANADSIKYRGKQYGFIVVATKQNKIDTLHLVRVKANQRVTSPRIIDNVIYDQDAMYAFTTKDLMVLQTQSFAKILSTPSYFRQ